MEQNKNFIESYEAYLEKHRHIMSKMFDPQYDIEKRIWLESIGVIKHAELHDSISKQNEISIELDEIDKKSRPWFLERIFNWHDKKASLSR